MHNTWQRIEAPTEGNATTFRVKSVIQLPSGSVEVEDEGFVVRFQGNLYCWLNHCPHTGSPLDWMPGRFFSEDGNLLVCHTHHALFDPATGDCLDGPCPRGLHSLPFRDMGSHLEVPMQHTGTGD